MCSQAAFSRTASSIGTRSSRYGDAMSVMRLPELLRAINTVAQTGADSVRCEALAREVYAFVDMVGWATGPIDPHGQLLDRLATLQGDLGLRFAQAQDAALAALHDSLTDLGRAIVQHDADLDPSDSGDEEGDDF